MVILTCHPARLPRAAALWPMALLCVWVGLGQGCSRSPRPQEGVPFSRAGASSSPYPVIIREVAGPPEIATGLLDDKGQPVTVGCATCHSTKAPNAAARLGEPLRDFHQKLAGQHGSLSCLSCHDATDGYASLRLADGQRLPYQEVMKLCAQCHGPQYRDYLNGAHGGMIGHWDLTQGGRVRNNCIHCHDPHAPKYPTVTPAPGPRDRFLKEEGHERK